MLSFRIDKEVLFGQGNWRIGNHQMELVASNLALSSSVEGPLSLEFERQFLKFRFLVLLGPWYRYMPSILACINGMKLG